MIPGGPRRGDVARPVLGVPGETLAHGAHRAELGELRQHLALAGLPRALDELHDADAHAVADGADREPHRCRGLALRSEEHTSELQSLMRISYAVFCLKKKQHKL